MQSSCCPLVKSQVTKFALKGDVTRWVLLLLLLLLLLGGNMTAFLDFL
jgi:hypothetical protein